jgi:HD-GYP domain-containing protein (c-di-GMP phosphodiesterase class II)
VEVVADFADLKSPFTIGHSRGVAALAASAAQQCGMSGGEVAAVRRAALLHDLGRVGVSAGIWNKPGRLTDSEWERVRLHPYYTERILTRSAALAPLGALAALHHERLDGSGYHRQLPPAQLPPSARILAAADVYHALTEPRPHRQAYTPDAAAAVVRREVEAGRLDHESVNAVLSAAGHRVRPVRREWPGGLSEREVEVLRLLARGLSNRQMALVLSISEKTVSHHIQHIYDKLDVSTRPAATLFAMRHGLLSPLDPDPQRSA